MFDIITFGSASWDIFVKPAEFKKIEDKDFITGHGICFNLGSKVDLSEVKFASGGGGTNTAATFAKQGFGVAYCGKVGDDVSGREIIGEIQGLGVDVSMVGNANDRPTNHSIVINAINDERSILVYRGASELLKKEEIPWDKIEAKWLYIAPLAGQLSSLLKEIVDFASSKRIKVAANLGNSELILPELSETIKKIDILILNQEEASILSKIEYKEEDKIFKAIDEMCPGITIMTKGDDGVSVSDGKHIYSAKPIKTEIVDKTGAGDAFGSGFVAGYMSSEDIEDAIQLGMANANGCISKIGAKAGLLEKKTKYQKVDITII